jgi:hypothetical protein
MDDIVKLNVGGQLFVTTRATLCAEAGSMLAAKFDPESKFAPPKKIEGAVFLDRDPITFRYVLSYLRHGCQLVLGIPDDLVQAVYVEADYFGLEALKRATLKPAAAVEPLSDEQLEGRVKAIRDRFMQDPSNMYKLMKSMGELSATPNFGCKFVDLNADFIVDCQDDERKAVFSMLAILVERNELTCNDVKKGLVILIEYIENEYPQALNYLGEVRC